MNPPVFCVASNSDACMKQMLDFVLILRNLVPPHFFIYWESKLEKASLLLISSFPHLKSSHEGNLHL